MSILVKEQIGIALALLLATTKVAFAQLSIDTEADIIASVPYNEVRIPATGGTSFDIARDLETSSRLTGRLRVSYTIRDRHVISALYAPLTIRSEGITENDIFYSGQDFSGNELLRAKYKFNSYRLTYRYVFIKNERVNLGFGLTGKIREANIVLRQGDVSADYPDLGFVPLINFHFSIRAAQKVRFILEGDALASRQGRAEDIFAGLAYDVSNNVAVKGGYRILEGGADVERNYNFTWVNYIPIGVIIGF